MFFACVFFCDFTSIPVKTSIATGFEILVKSEGRGRNSATLTRPCGTQFEEAFTLLHFVTHHLLRHFVLAKQPITPSTTRYYLVKPLSSVLLSDDRQSPTMSDAETIAKAAKQAFEASQLISAEERVRALLEIRKELESSKDSILEANKIDLDVRLSIFPIIRTHRLTAAHCLATITMSQLPRTSDTMISNLLHTHMGPVIISPSGSPSRCSRRQTV